MVAKRIRAAAMVSAATSPQSLWRTKERVRAAAARARGTRVPAPPSGAMVGMRLDGTSRALSPARAGTRWLSRNRLALALGALAALPVILSTVREAGVAVPVGDRALIAI